MALSLSCNTQRDLASCFSACALDTKLHRRLLQEVAPTCVLETQLIFDVHEEGDLIAALVCVPVERMRCFRQDKLALPRRTSRTADGIRAPRLSRVCRLAVQVLPLRLLHQDATEELHVGLLKAHVSYRQYWAWTILKLYYRTPSESCTSPRRCP